eukprot:COSAG01_NODE_19113_length_1030_cov_1.152524_1_plen_232_part_10
MRSAIHGDDNLLASSTARSDDDWQVAIIAAQDNGAPAAPTTGQVLRATVDSRISLESLRSIGISDFSHGGWNCSGYFNASYVARGKSEGGTAVRRLFILKVTKEGALLTMDDCAKYRLMDPARFLWVQKALSPPVLKLNYAKPMEIDDARGQTSELELKLRALILQRGIATTRELVANAKLWLSEGHSESVREVRAQQQTYSDRMEQDVCNDPTPTDLPLDAFAETLVGQLF